MNISTAAILSIGSEILEGRILNTNAQWLSKELSSLGFKVAASASCDDINASIIDSADYLLKQADVLITTGGLGPTDDDITREAVAELVGRPLVQSDAALTQIKAYFAHRKREMEGTNLRQTMFPQDSSVLENSAGTAPGFSCWFEHHGKKKLIVVLPGPPREMTLMYEPHVKQLLKGQAFSLQAPSERLLRIFGVGESTLGEILSSVTIPENVELAYRYHFPEVQLLFKSLNKNDADAACDKSKEAIGSEAIFSESADESLPLVVHNLLIEHKKTIALAESCTGGLTTKLLTDISGSSAYLIASSVTYAYEAKTRLLNVDEETLRTFGAVSDETAEQMAKGIRNFFETDIGVSITGIAGPTGGTNEKPVGTFHLGISQGDTLESYKCFFPGTRETIRIFAAHIALDLVRRKLLGIPPHSMLEAAS